MENRRLRPSQRIRKPHEFEFLHRKGKFSKGHYINFWVYAGPGKPGAEFSKPRLGVVVSRKTSPKASIRNLWKRRIREAFRHLQNRIKPSMSIMIQSKPTVEPPSYRELLSDLSAGLQKAGCFQ